MAAFLFISLILALIFTGSELAFRLIRAWRAGLRPRAAMFALFLVALLAFWALWFRFFL